MAVNATGSLYVGDAYNSRVLRFGAPLTSGMAASKAYGQDGSFTTNIANNGGISANSLGFGLSKALDAVGNLYVADTNNNRVLIFRAAATGDTTADLVFGQGDRFTTGTSNSGGINANSLSAPYGVALDAAGSAYIADTNNNRVLRFDAPLTSDTTADAVVGQAGSFTTNTPSNGGLSATSLDYPQDVTLNRRGNLYIADTGNQRVLEYGTPRERHRRSSIWAERQLYQWRGGRPECASGHNGRREPGSLHCRQG